MHGHPDDKFSAFTTKYTVDHIHAQKSVTGPIDERHLHSLGNLTLLVRGGNSSKGNAKLDDHVDIFAISECPLSNAVVGKFKGYGKNGAAAKAAGKMPQDYNTEWTETDIAQRNDDLVCMALTVFGFEDFPAWDDRQPDEGE